MLVYKCLRARVISTKVNVGSCWCNADSDEHRSGFSPFPLETSCSSGEKPGSIVCFPSWHPLTLEAIFMHTLRLSRDLMNSVGLTCLFESVLSNDFDILKVPILPIVLIFPTFYF